MLKKRAESNKASNLQSARKEVDKILLKLPLMSIYAPMIADLHFGDDHPINLSLVSLQILLSKLLTEIMTWKAANITFGDICNLARGTTV